MAMFIFVFSSFLECFFIINFLKIKSTKNPQNTPKISFIPRISNIKLTGIASEINIGIISSDVDKYTAINVPIDINLDEYKLVAEAENPHCGKIPNNPSY